MESVSHAHICAIFSELCVCGCVYVCVSMLVYVFVCVCVGEACWWTIHPASKQRSEGEKVRVGDDLILVSVSSERYLVSSCAWEQSVRRGLVVCLSTCFTSPFHSM